MKGNRPRKAARAKLQRADENQQSLPAQRRGEPRQKEAPAGTLHRERDILQVIMENTGAQLAYLDTDFNFVKINSAYARGSGHTAEELIGKNHFALFPNPENQAIFERVRDSGEPVQYTARPFTYADQPERGVTYWDWTLSPVKDVIGRVRGLVLSLVDVTEQTRAHQALAEQRLLLETLLEQAADGIMVCDPDGKLLLVNAAARHMTGLSPGQAAHAPEGGRSYDSEGRPVPPQERVLARALRGEMVLGLERHLVRPDGSSYDVSASAAPVRNAAGQIVAAVRTFTDITERKRAEEALRAAKDDLETRVGERTAELLQSNERLKAENQERLRTEQSLRLEEARLDALLHLSQLSEAPLNEITAFTLEQAIALTNSRIGFVGFLSEDEAVYTLHSVSREVIKECSVVGEPVQWPVSGAGIWADAVRERKTLFVNDYSKPHPRKKGLPSGHVPIERFMVVPVLEGGKIVTIAGVGNKSSDYNKSDERQLVLLLTRMWDCVQKSRSKEELQKAHDELEERVQQRTAELAAANEALKESQQDLGRAQEVGQIGWWRLDIQQDVLTWSDETYRIFGVPTGTPMTYETFLGIVHPDDREYVDTQWNAGLRGEPYDIEHRIVVDGQVRWAREKAYLEFDDAGKLLGGFGIAQDITERKQAEQQVKEERRRLQALLETAPIGIVVIDSQGGVELTNREAAHLLGFSGEPVERPQWYEQRLVRRRPDGRAYEPEEFPVRRALHGGESVRAEEVWLEFPDGHTVPTLIDATPIYAADGQIVGAIAVIQDITPLEEVEKLRGEFLATVSHELKTPLAAIKGAAATFLGSSKPFDGTQTRELFDIIDEQAERLREMVDDLLDMTRIEAGALSVSPEPADLGAILEEVRATFARGAGWRDIRFELPPALPAVSADRRRISQVLLNLLGNAAKFSPPDAPITVAVERNDGQVIVHVRDRGRGIPADKLSHLFKKFSQVHEGPGGMVSGSGLGLAICKGIVEAHGGRIWAESAGEGRGTTVSFALPVAVDTSVESPSGDARTAVPAGRMRRPGERTRVLAVDDEPQILRYLRRSLDEAGYQTIVTSDPSQVARFVELEEPDLVLLDLRLPGTSGFELLQQIREFSGVPVIFLTASDRDDDTVRALEMGADDYITKPFSPSELLARIGAVLRRRAVGEEPEMQRPFVVGDLTLNFAERRVTVGDQAVALSATEYRLLHELAAHGGRVLTYDQILHNVWGPEYGGETEIVRSFIRNLRRKLGDDARRPRYIFTEPQVGYRMPKSEV